MLTKDQIADWEDSEAYYGAEVPVLEDPDKAAELAAMNGIRIADAPLTPKELVIYNGIVALCEMAHHDAQTWYHDPATGEPLPVNFGEKIALIHSEVSEALEGHRKNLMDAKLPHRPAVECEFGDTFIRIADTAEHGGHDIAGAIIEKMRFNRIRADHKPAHRLKAGGKTY